MHRFNSRSLLNRFSALCFLISITLLLSACGFSLRGTTYTIPSQLKTIELFSSDPNGPLNRALRNELRLNNVKVITASQNLLADKTMQNSLAHPRFGVVSSNEFRDTVSIFANGKSAEYQLSLEVTAHLIIPNSGIYPINVKVQRSFFDNPLAAMQKNSEQEIIREELRVQAAQELVRRLSSFRPEMITEND